MTLDPRYLRGIDHFNLGEYFEAHEVWEDFWIEVNDERKGFLLGLIQAAVALHHARRGNARGARSLHRRMRANLEAYRPRYLGLDVETFVERMDRCLEPVLSDPPRPIDERHVPRLALDPAE